MGGGGPERRVSGCAGRGVRRGHCGCRPAHRNEPRAPSRSASSPGARTPHTPSAPSRARAARHAGQVRPRVGGRARRAHARGGRGAGGAHGAQKAQSTSFFAMAQCAAAATAAAARLAPAHGRSAGGPPAPTRRPPRPLACLRGRTSIATATRAIVGAGGAWTANNRGATAAGAPSRATGLPPGLPPPFRPLTTVPPTSLRRTD